MKTQLIIDFDSFDDLAEYVRIMAQAKQPVSPGSKSSTTQDLVTAEPISAGARICAYPPCSKEFIPKRSAKYCSTLCNQKHVHAKKKELKNRATRK